MADLAFPSIFFIRFSNTQITKKISISVSSMIRTNEDILFL